MALVRVLVDSVACLPPDLAGKNGIAVISVRIAAGGTTYRDTPEDLPPELVSQLQESGRIDTTPWPPEHYCERYLTCGAGTDTLIHVVASARFTSTMELARAGARMAKERRPDLDVVIVDSRSMLMAQGFVALSGARATARTDDAEAIVARLEEARENVRLVCSLSSMRHIARTGRVPRLVGWAGTLLNVRPIVGMANGKEHPLGLVRSRSQESRALVEHVQKAAKGQAGVRVAVMDSGRWDDGEELMERLVSAVAPIEAIHAALSPVSQVVAGPGLLGVAILGEITPRD